MCTYDQMYTCGTSLLCESAYSRLDIIRCSHHKIGKLVDNNDHLRHTLSVGVVCYHHIIMGNVTNSDLFYKLESAFHLSNRRCKCSCRFLRITNDRTVKVRNVLIDTEFNLLGVYHYELDLVGRCLVEQADYDRVDTYRLTHTRCTCDEQVGHLFYVEEERVARNICSECYVELALCRRKFRRFYKSTQINRRACFVWNFYSDCGFSRDRCFDTYTRHRKSECDIINKVGY